MKFKNLFSPMKINSVIAQNRTVLAPGHCGSQVAKGAGAGIVLVRGNLGVSESGNNFYEQSHHLIREYVEACHAAGSLASLHIHQFGHHSANRKGPSDGVSEWDGAPYFSMTTEDMDECVEEYAQFVKGAKDFDFDMIDMHNGHGWLVGQFLSPYFNKREDEFGGSLENRMRFPLRLVKAVREAVGKDFPVGMRFSATDFLPGGLNFDDALAFLAAVEPYIDMVEISAGTDLEKRGHVHSQTIFLKERMPNAPFAGKVKAACPGLVVAVVGAVLYPDEAERIITSGLVDMVSMSRAFMADPDWVNKAREGRDEDIIPCLRCKLCYSKTNFGCSVNPRYDFKEMKMPMVYPKYLGSDDGTAANKKRVVVVGAGPGGMQAAITAACRGHEVTLLEKNAYTGGALYDARKSDYKYEVGKYLDYLNTQLEKSNVAIMLLTEATPALVKSLNPDALLLAMGANVVKPPIPGIDLPHVMNVYEALRNKENWGEKLLVVGGGANGVEIALEQALKRGKQAIMVEATARLAANAIEDFMNYANQLMETTTSIEIHMESLVKEITAKGAFIVAKDETTRFVGADAVVYCVGLKAPDAASLFAWYNIAPQTFVIGDCRKSRFIKDAATDGWNVAMNL
ncbi:MAG: NAD(P)/FAD-dependent oxidoreductase [Clostridiales bacterium]|jgi:2,4-dienoyl-CoA reductase-like NADH-dependent reductase (Old Yellow Enzyme family)/thioredoxin reductase|nr:NAD(P)/FAD-dependent oxidoreductase [Clostridiales bacterium]